MPDDNKFTVLRLQFIEAAFIVFGIMNRNMICGTFGVSAITASRDMSKYQSLNPGVAYNLCTKQWEKQDSFVPTANLLTMNADTFILRVEQLFDIKLAVVAVRTRIGVIQK